MIIQLEQNISEEAKTNILTQVNSFGYTTTEVNTQQNHYIIGIGKKEVDIRAIGNLTGVRDIHRVNHPYKLVSREWRVSETVIDLGDGVTIEQGKLALMAGPCSIETEKQIEETIQHLKKNNISIMRGGVFKPRSSPYTFRGLGIEGLKVFTVLCKKNKIKIISEVMQVSQIAEMADYIDIFQVGTRNAQNFNLLEELGKIDKPVMIKRGQSGTIEELLQAAEYVFSHGNEKILLCERGIRTFETAYRNTFDVNAIAILKEKSHLPVIADPSHGIGIRKHIEPVALAGVMAGADGVILEVHQTPEKAISDGQQTLNFAEAEIVYENLHKAFELRMSMR